MQRTPFAVAVTTLATLAAGQSSAELAQQRHLEALFADQMSGCKMSGQFTVDGEDGPAQPDSYTLGEVRKIRDEKWRIEAKIEYANKSATVPLTVEVFWADETPVIQVTNLAVPTLGTFSARVLIHGDRYAGTWSGRDHGGQMYGRIERPQAPPQDSVVHWPTWRGAAGTGEAPGGTPPLSWSEEENVIWKTPLPGIGSSTPVVWGDRIYLTTAIETDAVVKSGDEDAQRGGEPQRGRRRGRRGGRGRGSSAPKNIYDFRVMAVDRATGEVVWSKQVAREVPHERGHQTASQASNSPLTDGAFVYAHFGSRGIHCLTRDGEITWSRTDFGRMQTRNQFGEGSSPALVDGKLIVNWDHEGDSFVVAIDARSGEDVWRKQRDEVTSWSTPVIAEVDGRKQAIISATGATRAYDVETGDVVWSCTGMTYNTVPTPIVRDGVAYVMSGFRGAMLQAIRLAGAAGDISESDHVLWRHDRQTSYVPSALLLGDRLYFLRSNSAVLSCLNAATGDVQFEGQRLRGMRTVYASPVGADGRVYLTSREGVTKVIKASDEYEELATNELDDVFDASPIVLGSRMYLRGQDSLYCLGSK